MAPPNGFMCTSLTGGAAGALDSINGSIITNGDYALVFLSGVLYAYKADTTGGQSESSPFIIVPDTNPGSINWELQVDNQAKFTGVWGMNTSQDTDTDHDIEIAAGRCWSDDLANAIIFSSALTKKIDNPDGDNSWAAGDNANGLDTGTVANSTWYFIYAIYNPTTDTADALFTATYGSPTFPSGYTKKRLIGFVLTDGSANIVTYKQYQNDWWWDSPPEDVDDNSFGTTKVQAALSVPTGVRVKARFRANFNNTSADTGVSFYPGDGSEQTVSDYTVSGSDIWVHGGSNTAGGRFDEWTDTSAQICYDSSRSGNNRLAIYTLGWHWER